MCENQEKNGIVQYLMLTFLIAWGIEAVIIAGERYEILTGAIGSTLIFLLIGLGAGFAPAYAVCILLRKQRKIHGLKDILRLTLQTPNIKQTMWITMIFFGSQFFVNLISEDSSGNPWYFFILFLPVMIIGGGIEEFGWRGFLQPQMEKKFPFAISTLISRRHLGLLASASLACSNLQSIQHAFSVIPMLLHHIQLRFGPTLPTDKIHLSLYNAACLGEHAAGYVYAQYPYRSGQCKNGSNLGNRNPDCNPCLVPPRPFTEGRKQL